MNELSATERNKKKEELLSKRFKLKLSDEELEELWGTIAVRNGKESIIRVWKEGTMQPEGYFVSSVQKKGYIGTPVPMLWKEYADARQYFDLVRDKDLELMY